MSEARMREVFAEAAEDVAVGPAPDLASFSHVGWSRRRKALASLGLVAAATAGIVVAASMVDGSPSGSPAVGPVTPIQTTGAMSLDCPNDMRSTSTWEAQGPYRRTPQWLGKLFTNPIANEHAVVQSVHGHRARVILLRGNGTAWARLDVGFDAGKGWYLGETESCPGRYVRLYWQHQGHVF